MNGKELLKIDFRNGRVKGTVEMLEFKEGDSFIVYSPSLQLSSYGPSKQESHEMMKEVLNDYCTNLIDAGPEQAFFELKKLGWKQHKFFKKRFLDPPYVDINGILREFNLSEATEVKREVVSI